MATLDLLNNKIIELKNKVLLIRENNSKEKIKLNEDLKTIHDTLESIVNNEPVLDFDYTKAVSLLEEHDYNTKDLLKTIKDIQNVQIIRNNIKIDIPLEKSQIEIFTNFQEKLLKLKDSILIIMQSIKDPLEEEKKITVLSNLKEVLDPQGKRKYYTEEMMQTFWQEFNLFAMDSDEEVFNILQDFNEVSNLQNKQALKPKADFTEVLALYDKTLDLPLEKKELFISLLNKYAKEVITNIDLENTQNIILFFKEKDILKEFELTSLLKVTLYGKYEYIKDVIYPKVMGEDKEKQESYFTDALATVWIKEKNDNLFLVKPFVIVRSKDNPKEENNLYSSCHTIDYDEFKLNVDLLNENQDLFKKEEVIKDQGAYLSLRTLPHFILKKNIELCRIFQMGKRAKVPTSALIRGDLEDKIHLAIELGLFNPPMSEEFIQMDDLIVKNEEFKQNLVKNNQENDSIRNYFQRYLTGLMKPVGDFAFLAYKLQNMGYLPFYNNFFSRNLAGKASNVMITSEEKRVLDDQDKMNEFLSSNFAWDAYDEIISDYDIYDTDLSEYIASDGNYSFTKYIDQNIFNDPLIKTLEDNYTIYDIIKERDHEEKRKNEYVYLFNNRIISRYKVLHNATILKGLYGYLNKEMLMTCLVHKSFIDKNTLDYIANEVMGRSEVL